MASRLTTYVVVLIVAGTLIAGLIAGAQRDDDSGPVDLIITNGKVYTGSADDFAEAIAVRNNKILRVGTNREIKRLRRPQTTMVDAHGAAVLPGFNDAHVHFLDGGLSLSTLDLGGASTMEAIAARVREYAAAHPDRPWIEGQGWYYASFPGGAPTRQQLDALVPDRPAFLAAFDGHTGWANSKALALAGINRHTRSPRHGTIVKDARSGEPTGVLKESAQDLVTKVMPQPTRDDRLKALRAAIQEAQRLGVTSIQNASGSPEELGLYDELRKTGDLQVRVYSALSVDGDTLTPALATEYAAVRKQYPDDPLFKAGAIKLIADGVVESYTAALLEPYANKPVRGTPRYTPEALDALVSSLDHDGWQIFVHAIGDRAVRMTLDAYQQAAAANRPPAHGRRHRVEHIETVDRADIPRFGALGVIASQQPYHGTPVVDEPDIWSANLGPQRASRGWASRSLGDSGARLAFGSDWPVMTLDPRYGIYTAVTRQTPDGRPESGWIPEERLALSAAIDAYTSGAAYASFDEHRKGRLQRDMLADIVILSSDIFAPDARILDAVVDTTIFDGKIVYTRTPATTD
jgi:predicted amidohydrolase YtcJ